MEFWFCVATFVGFGAVFITAEAAGTQSSSTTTINTLGLQIENIKNETSSSESKRDYIIKKHLPSRKFCGLQHTDDYFYFGNITSVDEFPWLVYINADNKCTATGALLNHRYVLTYGDACSPGKFTAITMGQHRINEDISCIPTDFGEDDCTSPSPREPIERVITNTNDSFPAFALIKLRRLVKYTEFIRPICLPLEGPDKMPDVGDTVVSSGWGGENTEGTRVKIKKRLSHTLMTKEECEDGNPVRNPICGFTFTNSTTLVCPGDSGGPLMWRFTKKKKNWVALGVLVTEKRCAKHQPVTATILTQQALDWIIDNIDDG